MFTPKRFFPAVIATVLILTAFIEGCKNNQIPAEVRGHSPWVFRVVLDEQPRMLVAALRDSFWVAYSTEHGMLAKVWRDGVNFEGPVYTDRQGAQPNTLGNLYVSNPIDNIWNVTQGASTVFSKVFYNGHRFRDGHLELNYTIQTASGASIRIKEIPEYVESEEGYPGLERKFLIRDLPDGYSISVSTLLSSVPGRDFVRSDGKLSVHTPPAQKDSVQFGLEMLTTLTLNPSGTTTFTTYFMQEPALPNPFDQGEGNSAAPPGLALIRNHNCVTCHQEEENTVGPSYVAIAEKYRTSARNIKSLAQKVISGGTGVWGENIMMAHPQLTVQEAESMVGWILSLDNDDEASDDPLITTPTFTLLKAAPLEAEVPLPVHGIAVNGYLLDGEHSLSPKMINPAEPVISGVVPGIHFTGATAFTPFTEHFYLQLRAGIEIQETGEYYFRLYSDDGSRLIIDNQEVIDHDGYHGNTPKDGSVSLEKGTHPLVIDFFQAGGGASLSLLWLKPGAEEFEIIPSEAFTYKKEDLYPVAMPEIMVKQPGDGAPLQDVHPSYTLTQARPAGFEPRVGGIDFLSDGRMVMSTWEGDVFILDNLDQDDPEKIEVKQIASGLAESLGLKVVDDRIYVLQKQELTLLVDHNNDEIADEYQNVCNSWGVSENYHEFSFGLEYKDGFFYANLSSPLGKTSLHHQDRGSVIKINPKNGTHEVVANGLRTPNGIGQNIEGDIFISDNQGNWLPASKIIHVREGSFYGYRSRNPEEMAEWQETRPALWLQQTEIGNSPSEIIFSQDGPYSGQMLYGEVTHGGVKRAFLEKVNGSYQGAVFRFTQGLEAGINRLCYGKDGAIYVGGMGSGGNWRQEGKHWYGLQRLAYNGDSTFEMLSVSARPDGVEITFTQPLAGNAGNDPGDYKIFQWGYIPTSNYGGPKINEERLSIESLEVSSDRRKVRILLPQMRAEKVVYIRLDPGLTSASGQKLWSTEAWYTMNQIPTYNAQ